MNRELEIRERVALYGLELTGHDREALYIARGNLEFYAYSDLRYLLSENARLRADLAEQSRLHRISVNAGADAMRQIKEQLAAMTAERDAMRERAEAARDDLRMVCTNGEPCAACRHCCDQGPNFPCRILDKWCCGEKWEWRGPEEDKQHAGR